MKIPSPPTVTEMRRLAGAVLLVPAFVFVALSEAVVGAKGREEIERDASWERNCKSKGRGER